MFKRPVPVLFIDKGQRVSARVKLGDAVGPVGANKQHFPAVRERLNHIGVLEREIHASMLHQKLNNSQGAVYGH